MTSPIFAKHNPDVASKSEQALVLAAARSATHEVVYKDHVDLLEATEGRRGRALSRFNDVVVSEFDSDSADSWDSLAKAMSEQQLDAAVLDVGSPSERHEMRFADVVLAAAYKADGATYPQILCSVMLDADVLVVQLSPTKIVSLLGVLESCRAFWNALGNDESAAAFEMILADSLYAAGKTNASAKSVVRAIELQPSEPYPWAVLCEILDEQDDGAFVNIDGLGRVDRVIARRGLNEAVAKQRVGFTVGWPQLALGTLVLGACLMLALRRRKP